MDKLWYKSAAKAWKDALPIGNGISGVMVYGGKNKEKLAFNDCTLWSGYPKNQDNSSSLQNLDKARQLVFDGKNDEADQLAQSKMIGHYSESFMPLGMVELIFGATDKGAYKRQLDISNAINTCAFGGTKREAFVSYPDKIAVYNICFDKKNSVTIKAKSKMRSQVEIDKSLNLIGNAPDFVAPNYLRTCLHPIDYKGGKGMSFCLRIEVVSDGKMIFGKKDIKIVDAKEITLYFATATGYINSFEMPSVDTNVAMQKCIDILKQVDKKYDIVKQRHIEDYKGIYGKSSFSLNDQNEIPTNQLLALAKSGKTSNALIELFYNYGKYLTIAGSRSGGQALNLQGLWNNSMRPPWSSNFTANINVEMNYWGASSANLNECLSPFVDLVYEVMQHGKSTAKVNYGCRGFACNHNVDIWRKSAPVQGNSSYMYAPMCGVWLACELFEHYKNGKLTEHKDKIFEIIKSATEFVCDYLVLHDGYYVTAPSASPENKFVNKDGKRCALDYASAFEIGLVRQIFANYLEIGDDTLVQNVKEKLEKLYPFSNGKNGINEWHTDFVTPEKGHRHFSPLYGFYPARAIKYYADETQREWVRQLFHYRVDNCTWFVGWSVAWAICIAGRLHDAELAKTLVDNMMAKSVFRNLFNVHPPSLFQIDGNYGFVGGINEMLVYTENDLIELLPACPNTWQSGKVKGYVVSGATIDFEWKDGKITKVSSDKKVKIYSKHFDEKTVATSNIQIVSNILGY